MNCTQTASAHTHDPRAFLHSAEPASRRFIRTASRALAFGLLGSALLGCEVDSWFDPSRTGRFETTPTTMPVLARLDVIEEATFKGATVTPPTMKDLVPQELKYRLAPGDEVRVDVFELITPGEPEVFARTIDQTGNVRLPEVGEIAAAGRTVEELQQAIELAAGRIIANPVVTVSVERQQGLQFTISGAVGQTGIYALTRPDLRLSEAIAIGGGTLPTTQRVKVIRAAPLDDTLKPNFPGSAGG
ncbi:MAG: polysaccharide biosynthesis/export family protein, partial [Planctomycetota bacterium]